MSDARWIEVFDDMRWAREHFTRALEIHGAGGFEGEALDAYKSRMALMQAMQAGHSSFETGLERIFEILGEEKPAGPGRTIMPISSAVLRANCPRIARPYCRAALPPPWMRRADSATSHAGTTTISGLPKRTGR